MAGGAHIAAGRARSSMTHRPDHDVASVDDYGPPPSPRGAAPGKSTLTSRLWRSARRDDRGVAPGAEAAVAGLGGGGAPLPAGVRDRFEASLGADLGAVRVHTDDASANAADAVGARAFARGNDIHFAAGQYQPDDPFGVHLLAHEVAHTVQQAGGAATPQYKLAVSSPGDAAEVEADRAADAMAKGEAASVGGGASSSTYHRSPIEKPTGPGTGPKKTLSGADAAKSALTLLEITLTPGAKVGDMILLYVGPAQCYYIKGQDIFEAYTPDFVRDIWLTSLSKGAAAAEWLIPLAKAEFALITALLAPWYLVGGISFAQAIAFYLEHRAEVNLAMSLMRKTWSAWKTFETTCPALAKQLKSWGWKQVVDNAPKGIELEDIAYFVGRVIGSQGLVGKIEAGVKVTAWVFTKVTLEYAVLVTALHAPKIVATGLSEAIREKAAELKKVMATGGIAVSAEDAATIVKELYDHPDAKKLMDEMKVPLDELNKVLPRLGAAWTKMMG